MKPGLPGKSPACKPLIIHINLLSSLEDADSCIARVAAAHFTPSLNLKSRMKSKSFLISH